MLKTKSLYVPLRTMAKCRVIFEGGMRIIKQEHIQRHARKQKDF